MMLTPLALVVAMSQVQDPAASSAPLPSGQRIIARDGDAILLEPGAHVRVVKRTEGVVRAIYNAEQRWLVLLVDYADANGGRPDGFVDYSYSFFDLQGAWPLGARWDGSAAIEEVTLAGGAGRLAVNLRTQSGLYQIVNGVNAGPGNVAVDPTAVARVFQRSGSDGIVGRGLTFTAAENREVENATMRASGTINRTLTLPNGATGRSSLTLVGVPPDPRQPGAVFVSGSQPVRVGGAIRTPQKIVDAQPAYPPIAQSARVQGVVILEITIAADGSVTDAKVLRSIPLLDQAALDCVRQWKYEPTQLNGTAVPVIMTVTVDFRLQ